MESYLTFKGEHFEIKECPFCHGIQFDIEGCQHSYVVCKGCLTEGPIDKASYSTSVKKAVELWNTR